MKGKVELNPESIALIKVQAPRDIIGNINIGNIN